MAKMTKVQEEAARFGDTVVKLPAPGKPKVRKMHVAGGDYRKFLEWAFEVRRLAQDYVEIHEAVDIATAASENHARSTSGKGKQWGRDGQKLQHSRERSP